MTARQIAADTLRKCERSGQYSNIALDNALECSELTEDDRALAAALFYGVTERRITLDYYISKISDRAVGEIEDEALWAIRLGLYQLLFMDRIPPHAAVNESVELCSRRTRGFVNAVLRSFLRRRGEISLPDPCDDPVCALSVTYSVGLPLCRTLCEIYGTKRTGSILRAFGRSEGSTLRVNTLRISRDGLIGKLGGEPTGYSSVGIRYKGRITSAYGFDNGLFFVQDEASQICVAALGAMPGDTVVDVCACPGSKSFGAAIDMKNSGKIFCFDIHRNKLPLIESSARRLGIDIISTDMRDAREPERALLGIADRVICDVPCSGFGVLGKKPELRYKDPAVSSALPEIQFAILESSAKYLRAGGTLVYSTCTILPRENGDIVKKFLERHGDFSLSPFTVGSLRCPSGQLTLFPDVNGTDGFFIAKLTKKACRT